MGLRLLGRNGTVDHQWLVDRSELFENGFSARRTVTRTEIHGSHLFRNGDVLINLAYVVLVRLNACGEVVWTLKEDTHHSSARAEDGTFWVPAVHSDRRAGSERSPDGFPGLGGKRVWIDRILHVSEGGTILRDITVLDLLYEKDLERFIPKSLGGIHPSPVTIDGHVTHLTDVEETFHGYHPRTGAPTLSGNEGPAEGCFEPATPTLRFSGPGLSPFRWGAIFGGR